MKPYNKRFTMNSNKLKQINRKTERLLVEWLSMMVSEEEAKQINTKNIMQFMPTEIHAPLNTGVRCVPMTPRWIKKELKKLVKKDKSFDVDSITLGDLEQIAERQRVLHAST
tara:strand:+ start:769 stop:1104 length:336 start_codon:yes stop_codon:yes gene_type:complete